MSDEIRTRDSWHQLALKIEGRQARIALFDKDANIFKVDHAKETRAVIKSNRMLFSFPSVVEEKYTKLVMWDNSSKIRVYQVKADSKVQKASVDLASLEQHLS